MKVYAQFLTVNLKGEVSEACGSDGALVLDGRYSTDHNACVAYDHIDRLKSVQPGYIGFHIIRAARFTDSGHIVFKTHSVGDPVRYNIYSENIHSGEKTYLTKPEGGRTVYGYQDAIDQIYVLSGDLRHTVYRKEVA